MRAMWGAPGARAGRPARQQVALWSAQRQKRAAKMLLAVVFIAVCVCATVAMNKHDPVSTRAHNRCQARPWLPLAAGHSRLAEFVRRPRRRPPSLGSLGVRLAPRPLRRARPARQTGEHIELSAGIAPVWLIGDSCAGRACRRRRPEPTRPGARNNDGHDDDDDNNNHNDNHNNAQYGSATRDSCRAEQLHVG
jgi:hypothetical protein